MPEKLTKPLFKTTIVIWSEYDPDMKLELADLAERATSGDAYCSKMESEEIAEPQKDPDWDGTEFFGVDEDLDEESSPENTKAVDP